MNWHDSGGAAFPIPHNDALNAPCAEHGMSLRDYFAGQAMAGIASMPGCDFSLSPQDEASWAYQRADAMIAAREVQS